jgi:hypothetical protein
LRRDTHSDKALAIALWLGLFFLSAFFVHWRLKSAYSATYSYFRWSEFGPVPDWVPLVLTLRWPMRLVAALGGALLALAEWRGGLVTCGLRRTLEGKASAALLLAVVGLASGSYYLLPGEPVFSSDAQAYVGYAALARMSLQQGQWPFWTNYGGLGMPFLQFYGPLYAVGVALTSFLIPNLFEATKLVQLALHVASVLGMYAFVARLARSRPAGLVAAWAYGFTFYRYHAILFNGILHLGVHLALMPWQFYCIEGMLAGPRRTRAWAGFALLGAASILAHPNYGVWVNILALLYGLLRIWIRSNATAGKANREDAKSAKESINLALFASSRFNFRRSLALAAGVAAALAMGAFPVAGSFVESDLVAIQWFQGARSFLLGPLALSQVFTFLGSFWTSEWFGGYVGISLIALALAALGLGLWRRDGRVAALGLLFAFTLYLVLGPGRLPFDEIFQRLPLGWIVYIYSTPGRYLPYVTFFAAALVGYGAGLLLQSMGQRHGSEATGPATFLDPSPSSPRRYSSSRPELLACLVVLVVSADLLPLSMQANSLRPAGYGADFKNAYAWLREHSLDPAARVLDPAASPNATDIQQFAGLPAFGSVAHEMPAASYVTIARLQSSASADLRGGALRREARDLLYLTNTAYLVTDLPASEEGSSEVLFTSGEVSVIASPAHSPLVVSSRVSVVDDEAAVPELLNAMHLDTAGNTAAMLPVLAPLGHGTSAAAPISVRLLSHRLEPQRASLSYELSSPGYVQLSYSYYPYLEVQLDGARVPAVASPLGFVVFASSAGTHTVELAPYLSAWRVAVVVAGLLVAIACVVLAVSDRRPPTTTDD